MTPDAPTSGGDPRAELEAELRALAERSRAAAAALAARRVDHHLG